MNHLPYRAIALDLDGTLTNHDKVVTPKTREALDEAPAAAPENTAEKDVPDTPKND